MFLHLVLQSQINNLQLAGRFKCFSLIWEQIIQDPWVLQVIKGKYQIEFVKTPIQKGFPNAPALSQDRKSILDREVFELREKHAIHLVNLPLLEEGFVSSLFVVPKKGGGNHPVVNLKLLNQFLVYKHFKKEGIHMLKDLLKQGDCLVKIDLKAAYLTVPIWKNHQKYLRFLMKGSMLEFACLLFGLATTPRVFTNLMKPVIALLRQRGFQLIIYLDDTLDGRVASSSPLTSSVNSEFARKPRFHCQLQEIPFRASTMIRVFRGPSGHQRRFPLLARRKTKKDLEEVPKHSRSIRNISRGIIKIPGLLTSSIQVIFPAPPLPLRIPDTYRILKTRLWPFAILTRLQHN